MAMQSSNITQETLRSQGIVLDLDPVQRWDIYHRLQELSVPCWCSTGQPLQVAVPDCTTLVQVWSVLKRHTQSRHQSIAWLTRCWQVIPRKPQSH